MNLLLSLEQLWKKIVEVYQKQLTTVSFNTWIEQAIPREFKNNVFTIEVPSTLHKDYWEKNLASKIVELGFQFTGSEIRPHFIVKNTEPPSTLQEKNPSPPPKQKVLLNPKYTFDTFVIGEGNKMAHAAALVVAENPGSIYNPLFFYGGVGLGKTHLMHAIGHYVLENNPQAKVKYVSSETFTNDFIQSLQSNQASHFKEEYRNVDLLLVDDIQFFANKEGTQEEFFHTFNELYNQGKQIVLTSDRLPKEIPKLQDRLVSRFAGGLSADITPPDLETRIKILRKKATYEGLELSEDTLSYIAGQIDSNIRELEGALVRIQAFATINNSDISTSLAADALQSMKQQHTPSNTTNHSIQHIQEVVCHYFNISQEDILSKKRTKTIVYPRQVTMYLSRELTGLSFQKIGKALGGKDHSTVMHAHEKIQKLYLEDATVRQQIEELKHELKF